MSKKSSTFAPVFALLLYRALWGSKRRKKPGVDFQRLTKKMQKKCRKICVCQKKAV